jgi:hypothetical protein
MSIVAGNDSERDLNFDAIDQQLLTGDCASLRLPFAFFRGFECLRDASPTIYPERTESVE